MKLEDHPFIQSMPERRRSELVPEIKPVHMKEGEVVFAEGNKPGSMYLVLDGKIAFTKHRLDGKSQTISSTGPGTFFGEISVFTGEPHALGAHTMTPATLAPLPSALIQQWIDDFGPVRKIFDSLIHHLNTTTTHYLEDVSRQEKLSLVGTMVSSILHDFKNPFSIISLGAEMIRRQYGNDPQVEKICQNIDSQIRRMVGMANDLAAFARGEDHVKSKQLSVEELFSEFHQLNAPFFENEKVAVTLEANGITLYGDGDKLIRALQNLVSNAIEAIQAHQGEGNVHITATEQNGEVILCVWDDGPGIPEKIRDHFFEPFVTIGKRSGTGLGSAIAKSIVEAHGGWIEFQTEPGNTTFTLHFPRQSIPRQPAQPVGGEC
ncbi:MAG: ATP-binding protein [Opitutales bacterium]